jgi:tetratricopeptide (TPR) repeat protein
MKEMRKFRYLNNKGVMYLENGLYNDADKYFTKASEILSLSMSLKVRIADLIDLSYTRGVEDGTFQTVSEAYVEKSRTPSEVSTMTSEDFHSFENFNQTRRQQKDSSNNVIGRPYWLTDHEKTPTHSFISLLCIILYNLGLCYHRQGLVAGVSFRHRELHLGRAIQVYNIIQTMARNYRIPAPVLFLSLHNMSQIYHVNGDPKTGYNLSAEVSNILRILHNGKDGYEKVLLGMISLQPWAFASAA